MPLKTTTSQSVDSLEPTAPVDEAAQAPAQEAEPRAASAEDLSVDPEDLEASDAQDDDLEEEDLDSEDSLTFSNGVIEKIVAIAMRDVPDVIGMKGSWFNRVQDVLGASDSRKGVSVEVTPDAAVRVNISVLIKYGAYAPKVFEDVKKAVVREVSGMTGLSVAGVNLRIEDVLTPEEYESGERALAQAEAQEAAEAAGATPASVPDEVTTVISPAEA